MYKARWLRPFWGSDAALGLGAPIRTKRDFGHGCRGDNFGSLRAQRVRRINRNCYEVDGRGAVVALTDVNGKAVDRYAYDSWGELTSNDAVDETVPRQLRYAGYWYDEKLSWYWLSVRCDDPEIARFLAPGPEPHASWSDRGSPSVAWLRRSERGVAGARSWPARRHDRRVGSWPRRRDGRRSEGPLVDRLRRSRRAARGRESRRG